MSPGPHWWLCGAGPVTGLKPNICRAYGWAACERDERCQRVEVEPCARYLQLTPTPPPNGTRLRATDGLPTASSVLPTTRVCSLQQLFTPLCVLSPAPRVLLQRRVFSLCPGACSPQPAHDPNDTGCAQAHVCSLQPTGAPHNPWELPATHRCSLQPTSAAYNMWVLPTTQEHSLQPVGAAYTPVLFLQPLWVLPTAPCTPFSSIDMWVTLFVVWVTQPPPCSLDPSVLPTAGGCPYSLWVFLQPCV